jgi:tRNA-uridine 2-sulfurtransferase
VALSGGVDSSVTAAILKAEGYDVVGMTLKLYDCQDGQNERSCCGLAGVSEARAAAGVLQIPHYVVDGESLFESRVLKHAWEEYSNGRTPNPCVACNEWMKFGLLFDQARKLGADFVATGHHARVVAGDRPKLLRGHDPNKDQSYFLFSLSPAQLGMALLPVGDLTKAKVRELAHEYGLPNADRLESQDACIAQRGDFAEALRERFDGKLEGGPIVNAKGTVIGRHEGIHRFTVGQRKGLGIALGKRAYVLAIDKATNTVVIDTDADKLLAYGLEAGDMRWLRHLEEGESLAVQAQIRYRHQAVPATLTKGDEDNATAYFAEAQAAVTPGQAAVFYLGDEVVAGGWIKTALPSQD